MSTVKRLRRWQKIAELIALLFGFVFLLVGVLVHGADSRVELPYWKSLLSAVMENAGTGLIAAGVVSFIVLRLQGARLVESVTLLANKRLKLRHLYASRRRKAAYVDIIAMALVDTLEELASPSGAKLLKRVIYNGVRCRMIFLSPSSPYVAMRATEEGVSEDELRDTLVKSVRRCGEIYEKLRVMYEKAVGSDRFDRSGIGDFEVRVVDICPHFTMFRADDCVYWGLYTSTGRGYHQSAFEVKRVQPNLPGSILCDQLNDHFHELWSRCGSSVGCGSIFRFDGLHGPALNGDLLGRLTAARSDSP